MSSTISIGLTFDRTGLAAGYPDAMISASLPNTPGAMANALDRALSALVDPVIIVNGTPPARVPGAKAAHATAMAAVERWCERNRVELITVNVAPARELFAGDKRAPGDAMVAEARRREFHDADAASALAIALLHAKFTADDDGIRN